METPTTGCTMNLDDILFGDSRAPDTEMGAFKPFGGAESKLLHYEINQKVVFLTFYTPHFLSAVFC